MSGQSGSVAHDATADYAALDERARAVLDCWFGAPDSATYGQDRKLWFKRDAAFDAMLHERFGELLDLAVQGVLDAWADTPLGGLALVIVLDQFSRNLYRGTARAFAGDEHALRIARQMVARGADQCLPTLLHRAFAYLPFEHDESLASQRESLRLFKTFEAQMPSATSSALPGRPSGVCEPSTAARSGRPPLAWISVSIRPGRTAFTRIPCGPSSLARPSVIVSIAPFEPA